MAVACCMILHLSGLGHGELSLLSRLAVSWNRQSIPGPWKQHNPCVRQARSEIMVPRLTELSTAINFSILLAKHWQCRATASVSGVMHWDHMGPGFVHLGPAAKATLSIRRLTACANSACSPTCAAGKISGTRRNRNGGTPASLLLVALRSDSILAKQLHGTAHAGLHICQRII